MYNMFHQLRLLAYYQMLGKKVSSTKIDDDEEVKDEAQNSQNALLREISANLEESERILLEKSTKYCNKIKSKSVTDINVPSKTLVLNTSKKYLSLSDLKRHIAYMNIKISTRTQKIDILKLNNISSSGDSETKVMNGSKSIKSHHQRHHNNIATDESMSSGDIFGFSKNIRRRHISPYELYLQSVKPIISNNINKFKKCGSRVIRHERSVPDKHFIFPSSHHALKVITSNNVKKNIARKHEGDWLDTLQCSKYRGKLQYNISIPLHNDKKIQVKSSKNEGIMCNLTASHKGLHQSKKKCRVTYTTPTLNSVAVTCGDGPADQLTEHPILTIQDPLAKHEFGCNPMPSSSKCLINSSRLSQPMIGDINNATQTCTGKHSSRIRQIPLFSNAYKKAVMLIANFNLHKPDRKSVFQSILICIIITAWSPILLAISVVWLLSYPLRPCFFWERCLKCKQKKMRTCHKNPSIYHKPRFTRLQHIVIKCKKTLLNLPRSTTQQSSQRQNQKQEANPWRKPCRHRDHRKYYSVFRADCTIKPLHRAKTIKDFIHNVFCSCDDINQSNVSSFKAKRNLVAFKSNNLNEPTLDNKHNRQPIIKSPGKPQNSTDVNKINSFHEIGTTTEPKTKSINLQSHDDDQNQNKSNEDSKWSFFAPIMKMVENYLTQSKFMMPRQHTPVKRPTDARVLKPKQSRRRCFQGPTSNFSKNLRGHSRPGCETNRRMEIHECRSLVLNERKKGKHKMQKSIYFADETEKRELKNIKPKIESLGQQKENKKLFLNVPQPTHEISPQKPDENHNDTDFRDSDRNKTNKLMHDRSSNFKYPVSSDAACACDIKTKEADATVGTDQKSKTNSSCQCPLIPTTTLALEDFFSCKCPTSGIEGVCRNCQNIKKANAAVETDQQSKSNSTQCQFIKPFKPAPDSLSGCCKCPISEVDRLCHNCRKIQTANAAVETDQISKSNSSCTCDLVKPLKPAPNISCGCKAPIIGQKVKKANATVQTDQKSKSLSGCECHLIKPTKLALDGLPVCMCPISKIESFCHNCQKLKKTNAAVETIQKSKSRNFAGNGSYGCTCSINRNTESFCHNCHKINETEALVEMKDNRKPSSVLKNNNNKPPERPVCPKTVSIGPISDKKINTCCQSPLLKPSKLSPDSFSVWKGPINMNTTESCHNCHKVKRTNTAVAPAHKLNSSVSCECHLIKPVELPPNGSEVKCLCRGNTNNIYHSCHKTKQTVQAQPNSELNFPRYGLHEANAAVGKDCKLKIKRSCEHMELHNLKYNSIRTPFQHDALNVYKLCPISNESDSLTKKKKKKKKKRKHKAATNNCFHTSEYLNVYSEVCGSPKEKFCSSSQTYKIASLTNIPHSITNNNKPCRTDKQTRARKGKPHSPLDNNNVKNAIKCKIEAIEDKNYYKSPFNDNEFCRGATNINQQFVSVGYSMSDCNNRGSNESESTNTKLIMKSMTTGHRDAGITVNKRCANKQCEMKKETKSTNKPIQATKTNKCTDKSQTCPCEQTKFSIDDRKSCSSQTFKKATFATPDILIYNDQKFKKQKPSPAKVFANGFFNFISGKNRKKKSDQEPLEIKEPSGILINKSNYKKQNSKTESRCYEGSNEPWPRTTDTALCPINFSNQISNLKIKSNKIGDNKSMEFSYFTMLKDLIDSKTFQNRNVCAQFNKTSSQHANKKPSRYNIDFHKPSDLPKSPCNNVLELQQHSAEKHPCVPADGRRVPPLVTSECKCVSPKVSSHFLPCVSSGYTLEHSVLTKCECPVPNPRQLPRFPKDSSCVPGAPGQSNQRFSPHNSNIMETNQHPSFSPHNSFSPTAKQKNRLLNRNSKCTETKQKHNITRSTNSPDITNPKLSAKQSTNIQATIHQKLSKIRSTFIPEALKQELPSKRGLDTLEPSQQKFSSQDCLNTAEACKPTTCPQRGSNISETNEQILSSQVGSNILETNEQKHSSRLGLNIPEKTLQKLYRKRSGFASYIPRHKQKTKGTIQNPTLRKDELNRELVTGKGDCGCSLSKPESRHLRPCPQPMATGKGDNSLSFNDKRDIIKMCFKRKMKITPSVVKCVSDSLNLVNNQPQQLPRIIDHVSYDTICKKKRRRRVKPVCSGTNQIPNTTGTKEECPCTQIRNSRIQHNNMKIKNIKTRREVKQVKSSRRNKREMRHKRKTQSKCRSEKRKKYAPKSQPTKEPPQTNILCQCLKSLKKATKKSARVKSVKSRNKKSSYRGELKCSQLYLATLRDRPWFWIYKLMPNCYPSFLRLRFCSKTLCTQCAFSLTCCLWAPLFIFCFVCYEIFACYQ